MNNESNIQGNQNIVLQGVTDSTITVQVGGETQEIRHELAELKQLVAQLQTPTLQVGRQQFDLNELEVEEGYLALYVGAGGQFTVVEDTDNQFALRAPVGADYMLGSAPVDLFVEIAPTLSVTDPTSLRFDGAIGFRYFFPSGSDSE